MRMQHGGLTPDAVRQGGRAQVTAAEVRAVRRTARQGTRTWHAAGLTGIVELSIEVCAGSTSNHTRNVRGAKRTSQLSGIRMSNEHRTDTPAQRRGDDEPTWHGQIHGGMTKAAPATPAANRECESLAIGKSAGIGSAAAGCQHDAR